MKINVKHIIALIAGTLIIVSCNSPKAPEQYGNTDRLPNIFPEYTNVVVPPNIAPLNFKVLEGSEESVARFTSPAGTYVYGDGSNIIIDEKEWKKMLSESKGKDIKVEVFSKTGNGTWTKFKDFTIGVAEEDIDQYISYRLIPPSYVAYEMLSINQRDLTTYDETTIYNNMIVSDEVNGQCINCHSYQNYHTKNMQFHMRQGYGGTIITQGKEIHKVDLKSDSTISSGVYPSWHPTLNLIAYSTNSTGQSFHTMDNSKIEVEDSKSDLILYDIDKNEVTNISNAPDEFEVYPWWAPTGDRLYFSSAHFDYSDSIPRETEVIQRYKDIKYDIYSKSFDKKTHKFGPTEAVYKASETGKSATLPRISPDGKYLLFSQGNWGCFHIWHPESDIYIKDLTKNEVRKLENVNSDKAESYHSWSSNGRWIIISSRRDDGNYTRLFIAYFDKSGHAHKAFELPQKDPDYYTYFLRSYNIPEFMVEPVSITPQEFASAAMKDAKKAKFNGKMVETTVDTLKHIVN